MLENINLIYVAIAVLFNMAAISMGAVKYMFILRYFKSNIQFIESVIISLFTRFANYLAPFKVGFIIAKPLITRLFSDDLGKSYQAVIAEQAYDIIWQMFLFVFLIALLGEQLFLGNIALKVALILIFIAVALASIRYSDKFLFMLFKFRFIIPKKIRKMGIEKGLDRESLSNYLKEISLMFRNIRIMSYLSLMTIFQITVSSLIIMFISLSLDVNIYFFQAVVLFWLPFVAGRISGMPAGLGSRDVTQGAILISYGITTGTAAQFVLLTRIISMFFPLILGGPIFLYLIKAYKLKKAGVSG